MKRLLSDLKAEAEGWQETRSNNHQEDDNILQDTFSQQCVAFELELVLASIESRRAVCMSCSKLSSTFDVTEDDATEDTLMIKSSFCKLFSLKNCC